MTKFSEIFDKETFRTTADMQKKPVDFHINPNCNGASDCLASGEYYNDDGITLDLEGNQNVYSFNFEFTQAATPVALTFTVTKTADATNFDNSVINNNDYMDTLYVHNALALGLDDVTHPNGFSVQATWVSGETVAYGTAKYDAYTDRLAFNTGLVSLGEVATFVMTSV